jgi:hypothetical protein
MFRKLDLFPSSGEEGRHLLSWVPWKELTSITGQPLFRVQSSKLLCYWRFTANQFHLATSPLRPTTRIFIFQLNTSVQLLLGLATTVILRSESHGTHDHILLSQI